MRTGLALHPSREPADERERNGPRQRAHQVQKELDLRREGNLVRLARELLQDLTRAALLAHHVELFLGIVRSIERGIDEARIDDCDGDAASLQFELHAFGEIDDRGFACAIAAVARPTGIADESAT